MANQKISELTQASSIENADLIPIAHLNNTTGGYETLSTSLSTIKSALTDSNGILYSDGRKAIYTSGNTLYLYDDGAKKVAYLNPISNEDTSNASDVGFVPNSKLAIGTSSVVEGIIKYTNRSETSTTSLVTKYNLSDIGFRLTREEYTGKDVHTGAWQLRMNTLDTYMYSKNHVEITAGSKTIDSKLYLDDLLTSTEADTEVRINLLSGGDIMNTARDAIYFTAPVFQVKNASEDPVLTITATDTKLQDASQGNILSQHYDSTNTANNTIKISRGDTNDLLEQDAANTNLYNSDGVNILYNKYDSTAQTSSTAISGTTVTVQADNFQVKSSDGNTLIYDNDTITGLVTTVAGKEDATLYVKRYAVGEHATYQYDSTRNGVIIPVYESDTTLKEMSSFTGKVSFWFSAIKDSNSLEITTTKGNGYSNTYTLKDVQYSAVFLQYLYNGVEKYVPLYIYNSVGHDQQAYVKDLYGKTIECSVSKDWSNSAGVISGSIEAEIMPESISVTLNATTTTYTVSKTTLSVVNLKAETTGCSVVLPTTLTTDKSTTFVISTSSSSITINGTSYQPGDIVFCTFDYSTKVWSVNEAQYNVLHTTGDETASGVKTFTSGIKTDNVVSISTGNSLLSFNSDTLSISRGGLSNVLLQENNNTSLFDSQGGEFIYASSDIDSSKNTITIRRGNANELLTQTKNGTTLWDSNDSMILSAGYDGSDAANNTLILSRGGVNNVLSQDKTSTTLSNSNGDSILRYAVDTTFSDVHLLNLGAIDATYSLLRHYVDPNNSNGGNCVEISRASGINVLEQNASDTVLCHSNGHPFISSSYDESDLDNCVVNISRLHNDVFWQDKFNTMISDRSGNILAASYDGSNAANNTLTLSRGGENDILSQTPTTTTLSDSSSATILTAVAATSTAEATQTLQANSLTLNGCPAATIGNAILIVGTDGKVKTITAADLKTMLGI